jgi:hypothetical protein
VVENAFADGADEQVPSSPAPPPALDEQAPELHPAEGMAKLLLLNAEAAVYKENARRPRGELLADVGVAAMAVIEHMGANMSPLQHLRTVIDAASDEEGLVFWGMDREHAIRRIKKDDIIDDKVRQQLVLFIFAFLNSCL